jgi:hypothetical protein
MAFLTPVAIERMIRVLEKIIIIISILLIAQNGSGFIKELTANTQSRLKIFEPITFPMAISIFFFLAAITDVTSSGIEVPIATIVNPTNPSLRLRISEM